MMKMNIMIVREPSHLIRRLFPKCATFSTEVPFYGSPRPCPASPSPLAIAIQSATTALRDPTRADAVAALGEVTGSVALQGMYQTMKNDPVGRIILSQKPIVSKETLPSMETLLSTRKNNNYNGTDECTNVTTFGNAYGTFLQEHGFDPDDRSAVQFIDDPELAYVMLRYRQCHDYWHALTGLPPTVLGELALKWVELIQTGLPVAALSATVGSLALENNEKERHILFGTYLPWAVRQGRTATYLLNVYYEEEFDTPLDELRERLSLEPAPKIDL